MRKIRAARKDMTSHTIKQFAGLPTPRVLLPLGDPERDRRTVLLAKNQWRSVTCTLSEWEKVLDELKEDKIAERYPLEKPYGSLNKLLKEEIGLTIKESRKKMTERAQLEADQAVPANKHGGDRKSEGRNQDNNCNLDKRQGNDPEYLTSRIARDRPDILERMKAVEAKERQREAANLMLEKRWHKEDDGLLNENFHEAIDDTNLFEPDQFPLVSPVTSC